MIDPEKLLEEADRFQKFLQGADTGLTEDELHRQERFHHALEMIKKYSFMNKQARRVHADKFSTENEPLSRGTIDRDFYIAWYLLGRDGLFNKDSSRNWGLWQAMRGIEMAIEANDLKALPKLLREWYMLNDLNKMDADLPDYSDAQMKELRVALHPKAMEMKNNPKMLEEALVEFLKPKMKNKPFEDAQIVDDGRISAGSI